jgi:hypothetical protein
MTSGTVSQDVKAYLTAVRARLDDLPAEERDDLLADVEPSLLDSAEEGDAPVELRLGPPHAFADELRAAAGLPQRAETADHPSRPGLKERFAAVDAFLTTSPTTRWLRDLAPLWWVLRGVVAVGLLEILNARSVLAGDRHTYALLVALAVVLVVAVSVAIGLRRPRRNTAIILVNFALALAAAPVLWHAISAGRAAVFNDSVVTQARPESAPGLVHDGQPVQNIYAFDREGRLLQDVRLFDQQGRPLEIRAVRQDPNRRTVQTRAGEVALNAFPIRYFEPGTQRVDDPAAGAPARPSPLTTKPLGAR